MLANQHSFEVHLGECQNNCALLLHKYEYDLRYYFLQWQDLEAAIDEEDVAKFTGCLKEYDSMTKLVNF